MLYVSIFNKWQGINFLIIINFVWNDTNLVPYGTSVNLAGVAFVLLIHKVENCDYAGLKKVVANTL